MLFFASVQFACKKFVDIKPSPNLIQSEQLFNNDAAAQSAVSGVYLQLRAVSPSYANGSLSVYCGLSSDELATQSPLMEYDAFFKNSILPTSTVIYSQLWSTAYRVIYRTNAIIYNLEKSAGVSPATKRQMVGEMKVVRSLSYFILVNLFGDIPLITTTNFEENERKPRARENDVYQQIITDLTEAMNLLSEDYPSNGKLRPNKFTAAALLARVYLFKSDWRNAETFSSLTIASGRYSLSNNLSAIFKNGSAETIWQIGPANESRNTAEGGILIPASATNIPNLYLNSALLNSFEPGDLRKANWLGANMVNGVAYFFPYKYKRRTPSPVDEYNIVFRLSEQFLIRAEARARQNKFSDAVADLNEIRARAGLPTAVATDQTTLLAAILKERQVELFSEWGHRWFDLKRLGIAENILGPLKGSNWQQTDIFFPIPFNEIQINSFLVQNPGY